MPVVVAVSVSVIESLYHATSASSEQYVAVFPAATSNAPQITSQVRRMYLCAVHAMGMPNPNTEHLVCGIVCRLQKTPQATLDNLFALARLPKCCRCRS
jgi:hypothetical protein